MDERLEERLGCVGVRMGTGSSGKWSTESGKNRDTNCRKKHFVAKMSFIWKSGTFGK